MGGAKWACLSQHALAHGCEMPGCPQCTQSGCTAGGWHILRSGSEFGDRMARTFGGNPAGAAVTTADTQFISISLWDGSNPWGNGGAVPREARDSKKPGQKRSIEQPTGNVQFCQWIFPRLLLRIFAWEPGPVFRRPSAALYPPNISSTCRWTAGMWENHSQQPSALSHTGPRTWARVNSPTLVPKMISSRHLSRHARTLQGTMGTNSRRHGNDLPGPSGEAAIVTNESGFYGNIKRLLWEGFE
ncbi:hypothetical protein Bbelb_067050 [Branchiostoma belcheri]|nr:hypothetical protein Bbelb_067050 [Branchiostoma belcheri]